MQNFSMSKKKQEYQNFMKKHKKFTLDYRKIIGNSDEIDGKLDVLISELESILYTPLPCGDAIAYVDVLYDLRDKAIHILREYDGMFDDDFDDAVNAFIRRADDLIVEGNNLLDEIDDYEMRHNVEIFTKIIEEKKNKLLAIQSKKRRIESYLKGDLRSEYINMQKIHSFIRSSSTAITSKDQAKNIIGTFYQNIDAIKTCKAELEWFEENKNVYDMIIEDYDNETRYGIQSPQQIINRLEWWKYTYLDSNIYEKRVQEKIDRISSIYNKLKLELSTFELMRDEFGMENSPVINSLIHEARVYIDEAEACLQKLNEFLSDYAYQKDRAYRWLEETISKLKNYEG